MSVKTKIEINVNDMYKGWSEKFGKKYANATLDTTAAISRREKYFRRFIVARKSPSAIMSSAINWNDL